MINNEKNHLINKTKAIAISQVNNPKVPKARINTRVEIGTKGKAIVTNGVISTISKASKLSGSNDIGTASAGGTAKAVLAANSLYGVACGTTEVAFGVGELAIKSIAKNELKHTLKTYSNLTKQEINSLVKQSVAPDSYQTAVACSIIHRVNGAKSLVKAGVRTGQKIVTAAKITRNVIVGDYSKQQIKHAVRREAKLFRNGVRINVSKGFRGTIVKGLPKTGRLLKSGLKSGLRTPSAMLKNTDDLGVQALGNSMSTAYHMVQTADISLGIATKAVKPGIKTAVHIGKGSYRTIRGIRAGTAFIKNNGLKVAWNRARGTFAKASQRGAKAVLKALKEALANLIKVLGRKIVVPICVIVVIVVGFNTILSGPVMAMGSIFGGTFCDKNTGEDRNIEDYLKDSTKGIPPKMKALKERIVDTLADAEASHDIVRFRANTAEEEGGLVIDHTYDAVSRVMPSDQEVIEMVQPLFNAVILMNYELEPTDEEAQNLLQHIIDTMFRLESIETTEYCGQDIITGEGEIDRCSCGDIHAHPDCPHPTSTLHHSSYKCDKCDYYECGGHTGSDGTTTHCGGGSGCSNKVFKCGGYKNCDGHDVITYTLNCDGIYALVAEYFTDPIDDLESTFPRTDEQENKLANLKSYYEIFEEMAKMVGIGGYSGGMTREDMRNIHWVDGSRRGCDEIVEFAMQYLGNTGGQKFWSYLGFRSHVAWCACFVYYVMRESGYGAGYPTSSNYAYCQTMAEAFSREGQFKRGCFDDIVAGDVIYFDWGKDGHTDHTGIVIGRDENKVYTIEGNSGDKVKMKAYDLHSGVIYGYGLMNY